MRKIIFQKIVLLTAATLLSVSTGFSGEGISSGPVEAFRHYHQNVPQQKVVLVTDKQQYLAGETIWIQAFLVSARTHKPDTVSNNLYVEFVDASNNLQEFLILKLENGFASGSINLPDSFPGGNYQLKAYTNWMINFDKDFHFVKDVLVVTPNEENFVERDVIRQNRRFNTILEEQKEQMQFAFFPEGGNLVAGIENRVAFMAANAIGTGVGAKGVVVDQGGREVANVQTYHNGKGIFNFVPQAGMNYTARIEFENGEKQTVSMPSVMPMGMVLRIDNRGDTLNINVKANLPPNQLATSSRILLLGHTRGNLRYAEEANLVDNRFDVSIPSNVFPDGIAHFTLFDSNGQPLAERLVFVNNDRGFDPYAPLPFSIQQEDGQQVLNFYMPKAADTLRTSAYALAVTTLGAENNEIEHNIVTHLLLTSDLGRIIDAPWYYLSQNDPERVKRLDLLMMTHGWRRFEWGNLLEGILPPLRVAEQTGLTLFGQITPISSARPTGRIAVELSAGIQERRARMSTTTTDEGFFTFSGLDFSGVYTAMISVGRDRRGRIFEVSLFDRLRQSESFILNAQTIMQPTTERGPNWQRKPQPNFWQRLLTRDIPARRSREPVSMFGTPDQQIFLNDLDVTYTSVFDILRDRVTGLNVVGGQIVLRGVTSFMLSSEPVFFVDEVQVSRGAFLGVPVSEIERIGVLRAGASTAILGTRGGNGALLIYTRREIHQRQHSFEFQLRGYHVPDEFFQSRIQVDNADYNHIPRTMLWAPMLKPDANGKVQVILPEGIDAKNLRYVFQGLDADGQPAFIQFNHKILETQ